MSMARHSGRRLLVAALLLASGVLVMAEEQPRPKIALVLSGGGARGAAHVGVIRELEALHIPIDLVVGTSMGSVVGGLYAAGYSAEELTGVLEQADWLTIFSDKPARKDLWYRRRQDDRIYQVDLELGWHDDNFQLPPGFIIGLNTEAFLERQLMPVITTKKFDDLPIPFRCVATEGKSGDSYVFADGSLVTAIRASMSIPGVFAPVEYRGHMLIDGGIVDNLPIGLAQQLGADVVIAVDLSNEDVEIPARSAMDVFNQMLRIFSKTNHDASLARLRPHDVLLKPDVSTIGIMEFDRYAEGIASGQQAAVTNRERLAKLSIDPEAYRQWRHRVLSARPSTLIVRNVRVQGKTKLADSVLAEQIEITTGSQLTAKDLGQTRAQLSGLGIFQHVDIDLKHIPAEAQQPESVDVVITPKEKSWGPNYFRFGLGVSSNLQGEGDFDVGFQHTWTPVNGYAGEWRNEVLVGTRGRLFTEFYQPVDADLRWFVAPYGKYEYYIVPLIVDRKPIADYNINEYEAGMHFGRNLGKWGEWRIGYGYTTGTAQARIAPANFPHEKIHVDEHAIETLLSVDTLDSSTMPRHGVAGELRLTEQLQQFAYGTEKTIAAAKVTLPATYRRVTVLTSLEWGSALHGDAGLGNEFDLGGFRRLSGLAPREFTGDQLVLGVVQISVQLGRRTTLLDIAPFVGATLEAGNVWQDRNEVSLNDLKLGSSVFVGAETFIGQTYFGIGHTEGGNVGLYLFIGPIF